MLILKENDPIDLNILSELYSEKDDLLQAWPKAIYPFDKAQWETWFEDTSNTRSVFILKNSKIIGHFALKSIISKRLYLCFVLITKEFRGKNIIQPVLELINDFVKNHYSNKNLYLHVNKYNTPAFNAYKKFGYKLVYETNVTKGFYRMKFDLTFDI